MEPIKRAATVKAIIMKQAFKQAYRLIRSDFIKRCEYEHKSPTWIQAVKFLLYPAFTSVLLYRIQHFFAQCNLPWIAGFIKTLNEIIFSVSIDSSADIGERFMILHASFIVIGPGVKIGTDLIAVHHNGVLPSPFYSNNTANQAPMIGDHVVLGGGAQITGDVTIGNHVQISMNASVEESFDDNAVLFGVPARNLQKKAS